ncbi:DUF5994 family protein [Nocardia aurea]|uniref:DUF5994 family protein n=1 Tax=Nocardia aurea TaxID=2144174 RepID=UPI0038CD79EF
MTTNQIRRLSARHRTPPEFTPRSRLKPKTERNGYVDGARWPGSSDLTDELPDLPAVLSVGPDGRGAARSDGVCRRLNGDES